MSLRMRKVPGTTARFRSVAELAAIVLILLISFLAYCNAWPDVLVHDDKFFGGTERFAGPTDWTRAFREDLWAGSSVRSGLYRPLLLLSLVLDARLFGDWLAGYHLVNIFLHGVATLLVYGLIRALLRVTGTPEQATHRLYALLAALVFAVHPVHAEVVNSVYNRSEMLVTIFAAAGLWWFLNNRDDRTGLAWLGLGLTYLLALFSKESGVVLPALAVALALLLDTGPWKGRIRKCLPALWLLLPLAVYLWLRGAALSAPGTADLAALQSVDGAIDSLSAAKAPGWARLVGVAGVLGASLKLMVWPQPLLVWHALLTPPWPLISLLLHLSLVVAAVVSYRRKCYGLIIGLAFFYLAFLPSSRLAGLASGLPHVAERYLYLPSVGLAIAFAFGIRFIGQRFGFMMGLAPVILALMMLTPLTWARNADWSSEVTLFESDLVSGGRNEQLLRVLTGAHLREGNYARIIEICDLYPFETTPPSGYANHCGITYGRLGQIEKAEQAFLFSAKNRAISATAHANLARLYLRQGRRAEAETQLSLAVQNEKDPARKAYRKGLMLARLYPSDPERLREARTHFEEALRLQPHMVSAQTWVKRIDDFLEQR